MTLYNKIMLGVDIVWFVYVAGLVYCARRGCPPVFQQAGFTRQERPMWVSSNGLCFLQSRGWRWELLIYPQSSFNPQRYRAYRWQTVWAQYVASQFETGGGDGTMAVE